FLAWDFYRHSLLPLPRSGSRHSGKVSTISDGWREKTLALSTDMRRVGTIVSLTSQLILSVSKLTSSSRRLLPMLSLPKTLPGQSLSLWLLPVNLCALGLV